MSTAANVHIKDDSDYENIYFDCPHQGCKTLNILNRATDLDTPNLPVASLDVPCQKCGQIVHISGDRATLAYRWFLHELYRLKKEKHYIGYVLSLCQGMESFFYQAVRNKEVDRNSAYRDADGSANPILYAAAAEAYDSRVLKKTFVSMRSEFLQAFQNERANYIPAKFAPELEDKRLYFDLIEHSDIGTIRNNVVHKYAYRPSWADIEKYDELEDAITWLGFYLDIEDSTLLYNRSLS